MNDDPEVLALLREIQAEMRAFSADLRSFKTEVQGLHADFTERVDGIPVSPIVFAAIQRNRESRSRRLDARER